MVSMQGLFEGTLNFSRKPLGSRSSAKKKRSRDLHPFGRTAESVSSLRQGPWAAFSFLPCPKDLGIKGDHLLGPLLKMGQKGKTKRSKGRFALNTRLEAPEAPKFVRIENRRMEVECGGAFLFFGASAGWQPEKDRPTCARVKTCFPSQK